MDLTKWPDIRLAAEATVIKHFRGTPLHRELGTRGAGVLIIQNIPRVRHTVACQTWAFISRLRRRKKTLTEVYHHLAEAKRSAHGLAWWCLSPQHKLRPWEDNLITLLCTPSLFCRSSFFLMRHRGGTPYNCCKLVGVWFWSLDKISPKGPVCKRSKAELPKGSGNKWLEIPVLWASTVPRSAN